MPVVGAVTGGLGFSNYYLSLSSNVQQGAAYADAKKQGAVIGYGQFLTIVVNFLIVAAVLFLVMKAMNHLKRQEEEAPKPGRGPRRREAAHRDPRPARVGALGSAGGVGGVSGEGA